MVMLVVIFHLVKIGYGANIDGDGDSFFFFEFDGKEHDQYLLHILVLIVIYLSQLLVSSSLITHVICGYWCCV